MQRPDLKADKYVLMVILLIITAIVLPVICRLFSIEDLWLQMAGATLGIVFGAVITSVMLKWQTRSEAEQERDSRAHLPGGHIQGSSESRYKVLAILPSAGHS